MANDALFEVYHLEEQRWQAVMPGYAASNQIHAILHAKS